MSEYYDRQGKPMELMEWASIFEQRDKKQVAHDLVGHVRVSTVWLGLNHAFGDGPPLIFETLVFGGSLDMEMDRYSTEDQALVGHAAMVERVRQAEAK